MHEAGTDPVEESGVAAGTDVDEEVDEVNVTTLDVLDRGAAILEESRRLLRELDAVLPPHGSAAADG